MRLAMSLLLLVALSLAGCSSKTDESTHGSGDASGSGELTGTVPVTSDGNSTETTNTTNGSYGEVGASG